MTIEELDILVEASIKPAMDEIKKLIPEVKKYVGKAVEIAQQNMEKVDMKKVSNKVQQAFQLIKKKIDNLKKSSQNNEIAIKINNKEASKNISQIEKEIDSLQKKINARQMKLDILVPEIEQRKNDIVKENLPEGIKLNGNPMDDPFLNRKISEDKELQKMILEANKLKSSIADDTKEVQRLKEEINQTANTQNKLGTFFSALKGKISQIIPTIIGMKSHFNQMQKITQNVTNNIKKMTANVKSGLSHILRYAGALVGIRAVYNLLRNSAQAWLSSQNEGAQQLSANIEYMKYAMGTLFAPVIEYVINLVYQLLKALQSLVYVFSGVNIFAKATASSMKSTAGSAKEASKSLAGVHGEINNVSEQSGGGGGSASPNMDLSEMDEQMPSFAKKLYEFFAPLKESWDKYGSMVIDAFKNALGGIIEAVSAMWSSIENIFTNGTIYSIIANILNSIGKIGKAWANAWNKNNNGTKAIQGIANIINSLTKVILKLVSSTGFQSFLNGIISAFSGIIQFLEPVIRGLTEMVEIILEIVMSSIGELLQTIGDILQTIGQNETAVKILEAVGKAIVVIVSAIIAWNVAQAILNGLIGIFKLLTSETTLIILAIVAAITAVILIIENWGAISEWFGELWENITNKIKEVWENTKQFFIKLWDSIVKKIKEVWNGVKEFFEKIWNGIKDFASNVFNGIKNTISNVLDGIKNVWTNVWNGLKSVIENIWNGIWNFIKGIINSILGGIEAMANGIVRGINRVVDAVNTVHFDVPDWVPGIGGQRWGFNLGHLSEISIPRLNKGNVAYDETLAIFGEYAGVRNNPEITAPQNVLRDTFEDVLSNHEHNDNNSNGEIKQLIFQFGSYQVAVEMERLLQQARRQNGTATVTI